MTEEFKKELREAMAMPTENLLNLKKRPKKGQALSDAEVKFVNDMLTAQAINSQRTLAEMIETRDWVNGIRQYYRIDKRDSPNKGVLLLSNANFEKWANDQFANYLLSEKEDLQLEQPDIEKIQSEKKRSFKFLGVEI